MGAVILVRKFVGNFVRAGVRGRARSSALLLGMTVVLTSCGGAGAGGGGSSPAPTATLTAKASTIASGQTTVLMFSSTNATTGTINPGSNQVGISGNFTTPVANETTTYTFTATGPDGSATAQATVTVDAAPTVTISASPTAVDPGGSTVLTVAASNDTQVVVTDDIGDPPYAFPSPTGGTQSFTPRVSAHYTATATGVNGDINTSSVLVTVLPPASPTVTLSANPTAVVAGQSTTLSWTSTYATSIVITASVGQNPNGVPIPSGSVTVPPLSATVTYTATAYGANGTTPAMATVTVPVDSITSFPGMAEDATNQDDKDVDPNGAVGTKQFLEYVNSEYQGYAKTAPFAPVWPTAQQIYVPWQNANPPIAQCDGNSIQADAVITFDRLALVWVIAAKATRLDTNGEVSLCVAVSNTDDLTSQTFAWYAYLFQVDFGKDLQGTSYLPDWPKIGTGPDAYYMTADLVDTSTQYESGVAACALDRTDMLLGVPENVKPIQCKLFKVPPGSVYPENVYLGHSLIPADVDGTTPPPAGRDEYLVSIENPSLVPPLATTTTTFNLWDFHVDWSTPANTTLTQLPITVPAYTPGCYLSDPQAPAITYCVPEPGTGGIGQKVDSVGDRFMPRFTYRNFGTYESFLFSTTVQTGLGTGQDSTQTGILWYELRGSGTPTVYQQGLISPDNNYYRFLPSIAQDHVGNAAVGYSISNTFTDPGINVSYWNLPNATQPNELTILNGNLLGEEVSSTGVGNWGSYDSMTVDPVDDCTFWFVDEYWPTNASWATNISFFQLPGCSSQ